jgi:branched-subunit amino acid transport protein
MSFVLYALFLFLLVPFVWGFCKGIGWSFRNLAVVAGVVALAMLARNHRQTDQH